MKGLLIKDGFVLFRQMKIILLVIFLFTLIPNRSAASFALLYGAMLPISVMGYDERAKWDKYAATMPYTPTQIVCSKYLVGLIVSSVIMALILLRSFVISLIPNSGVPDGGTVLDLLMPFCGAMMFLGLILPFLFKVGVEKGRLLFMILLVAGILLVTNANLFLLLANGKSILPYLLVTAAIVVNAVSIPLSVLLYKKRNI